MSSTSARSAWGSLTSTCTGCFVSSTLAMSRKVRRGEPRTRQVAPVSADRLEVAAKLVGAREVDLVGVELGGHESHRLVHVDRLTRVENRARQCLEPVVRILGRRARGDPATAQRGGQGGRAGLDGSQGDARPGRSGTGQGVALPVGHIEVRQGQQVVERLDALRAHRRVEAPRIADHRVDQRLLGHVSTHSVDHRPIELDEVWAEVHQMPEAGVPGAHVVHGDAGTTGADLGKATIELAGVLDLLVLGHLEHQIR